MGRSIFAGVFCLLLLTQSVRAQEASSLTADDIKAIVAKPHQDKFTLKGLDFLPNARVWNATGSFVDAEGQRIPFKGKTATKRVDGKYDVGEVTFEGLPFGIVIVTTWDPKSELYYRYVMSQDGGVAKSIGLRVANTRSIAWASGGGEPGSSVGVDTYEDKKMTWRSTMVNKAGGVTMTTVGEATAAANP